MYESLKKAFEEVDGQHDGIRESMACMMGEYKERCYQIRGEIEELRR